MPSSLAISLAGSICVPSPHSLKLVILDKRMIRTIEGYETIDE
jgi:hypothetical protein